MKRPLAAFGAGYLLVSLLAVFVPQTAALLLAALFLVSAIIAVWRARGNVWLHYVAVLSAAATLAMSAHLAYDAFHVAALRRYDTGETPAQISGVLLLPETVGAGDTVEGFVRVDTWNAKTVPKPFYAMVRQIPVAQAGQRVTMPVLLWFVEPDRYAYRLYADDIFLQGVCVAQEIVRAESDLPAARLERMRNLLGDNIRALLPYDVGAIASAMSIGEKSALTTEIKSRYRSAGLSHVLVVSGMHLGIISAAVYELLRRRLRRNMTVIPCCAAIFVFMILCGLTPSLVRAGVCALVMYFGILLSRRSDALTSLAFSAVLLCVQNPYAAADVGLLLSYSATLGVLYVNWNMRRWLLQNPPGTRWKQIRYRVVFVLAIPIGTALFTLPVQAAVGSGVSLLTVLCNLLAIPLLGVIVVSGVLLALLSCVPWLVPFAKAAGLVCGVAVEWLDAIARWADQMPFALVHVSGAACVTIFLCAGIWIALGHVGKRALRVTAATTALFFLLAISLYAVADAGVVRIALVGGGQNPCVVVTQQLKTLVLYRGPDSNLRAVKQYLSRQNRVNVDLLIDLRTGNPDTEALKEALFAKETISAQEDVVHHRVSPVFYDIMIKVYHQADGNVAYCNVGGYTFGVAAGKLDAAGHPPVDLYLGGSGAPQNLTCKSILIPETRPKWLNEWNTSAQLLDSGAEPLILVRAGSAVRMQEVEQGYAAG